MSALDVVPSCDRLGVAELGGRVSRAILALATPKDSFLQRN
ncbi:hypothetical protein [Nocardia sp. NPDC049707]